MKKLIKKPSLLLAVAWAVGMIHYGSTKGWVRVYNTDKTINYLTDNGSYTTNDYVCVNLTRSPFLPDTADFYVWRKYGWQTNVDDWVRVVYTNIGSVSFPTNIMWSGANTNDWIVGTSYEKKQAETNGVAVVYWGKVSTNALVPIRTGIYTNGVKMFPQMLSTEASE